MLYFTKCIGFNKIYTIIENLEQSLFSDSLDDIQFRGRRGILTYYCAHQGDFIDSQGFFWFIFAINHTLMVFLSHNIANLRQVMFISTHQPIIILRPHIYLAWVYPNIYAGTPYDLRALWASNLKCKTILTNGQNCILISAEISFRIQISVLLRFVTSTQFQCFTRNNVFFNFQIPLQNLCSVMWKIVCKKTKKKKNEKKNGKRKNVYLAE